MVETKKEINNGKNVNRCRKSEKKVHFALVGNPNCGKTTLFNQLTGSSQYVGNWPGVTVEKKSGTFMFKGREVDMIDLPGNCY